MDVAVFFLSTSLLTPVYLHVFVNEPVSIFCFFGVDKKRKINKKVIIKQKPTQIPNTKTEFLFWNNNGQYQQASLSGRNVCLDNVVDLRMNQVEDEDDAKATPKDLLHLLDRHERKFQPNIKLPPEVNLGTAFKPNVVMVGPS